MLTLNSDSLEIGFSRGSSYNYLMPFESLAIICGAAISISRYHVYLR